MINISEIHQIEKKRKEIKKQIYKKIYDELCRKIRNSVSIGHKQIILNVPRYLFGYPTYDLQKATEYMKRQFEHSGFTVHIVGPGEIYVSWKKPRSVSSSVEQHPEDEDFPTFVNLKKIANTLRKQK